MDISYFLFVKIRNVYEPFTIPMTETHFHPFVFNILQGKENNGEKKTEKKYWNIRNHKLSFTERMFSVSIVFHCLNELLRAARQLKDIYQSLIIRRPSKERRKL